MKKVIESKCAPAPIGPYSQAIETDEFVFVSGSLGLNPETAVLEEGIENQTDMALRNTENILKAANLTLKNVVKTTIYITDMNDFATVNGIYAKYFTEDCPARTCVEVSKLPKGGLVEIEVIAKK